MTISLFFSTLISLEDKWNHMLAVVLGGKKTEQEKKKTGKFWDDEQDEEEQSRAEGAGKNWFGKNTSHIVILSASYFSFSVVHLVIEDEQT